MQYVYALNPVCIVLIVPDTPAEVLPVRWNMVNLEFRDAACRACCTLIMSVYEGFNSVPLRFLIFKHTILLTKGHQNNVKKPHITAAGPAYYRMCSTDVYCSKQTGSSSTKEKTITHHFFVSGIGRRKLSMQQICGGAENIVKTETQQTFVNGLLGFITLGIYTPLEAYCVLLTIVHELPIDMGNSIYTAH